MSPPRSNHDATSDSLARLDRLLEHRARLGACVLLAGVDAMSFTELREALRETDGNLGAQLRKLEDEGYLRATKEFQNRRPVTWYRLAPRGRKALAIHLAALEALIRGAQ